ncbi:VOC family protein [Pseudooceanicola sp. CBS1P-1]|uniref:Lactoylglutathione lyase n=1 Tax=Pseudooceanicola albus TaxID=2692189 RepID=A0A6L7GAI2_9RHOB|nr:MULTISPECIES: VOC family protein [Pseudooceanicola]MBT9386783.1 VOC family protein [Pseudooceanicola endophyticus]MXN20959.1 lactoylglutathione lyase [Pseudooceanicola albus]
MADGLFPGLRWHHVGLSVGDLDRAIAFYTQVFGLEVEERRHIAPIDTHLAFLHRDGFRLELFQKAGSAPVPAARRAPNTDLDEQGTKHPCFSVPDCQQALDVLAARDDVTIIGVIRAPGDPMHPEADPCLGPGDPRPPAAAFFFRDPCDLIVEVVAAGNFPS